MILFAVRRIDVVRHKNRAIFYRIAACLEPVSRDALYLLFWPDFAEKRAHRALTQALTQLRAELPDRRVLHHTTEAVWLDSACVWSDAAAIDRLADRPPTGRSTADLEAMIELHRGRFLDGVDCSGEPELEDWAISEADRLETLYLHALAELIRRYADAGRTQDAIAAARRYLHTRPLDEAITRLLITLYAAAGDRKAAHDQFRRCALLLEGELGIRPAPLTCAAYKAALDGRMSAASNGLAPVRMVP